MNRYNTLLNKTAKNRIAAIITAFIIMVYPICKAEASTITSVKFHGDFFADTIFTSVFSGFNSDNYLSDPDEQIQFCGILMCKLAQIFHAYDVFEYEATVSHNGPSSYTLICRSANHVYMVLYSTYTETQTFLESDYIDKSAIKDSFEYVKKQSLSNTSDIYDVSTDEISKIVTVTADEMKIRFPSYQLTFTKYSDSSPIKTTPTPAPTATPTPKPTATASSGDLQLHGQTLKAARFETLFTSYIYDYSEYFDDLMDDFSDEITEEGFWTAVLMMDYIIWLGENTALDNQTYIQLFYNDKAYFSYTVEGFVVSCHIEDIFIMLSYRTAEEMGYVRYLKLDGSSDADFNNYINERMQLNSNSRARFYCVSGSEIRKAIGIAN